MVFIILFILMSLAVQATVSSILAHILTSLDQSITLLELNKKLPLFTHADTMTKTYLKFQASHSDPESNTRTGMIEQQIHEVKHLEKDSLMPKGVEKESEEIDQVEVLAESLGKKRKGLNNTKTSFNRSNIHSVNSNTNRNSKMSAFSRKKSKKEQDLNLISLATYEQDPQIQKLWKLKDTQILQLESQRKALQQKNKQFQDKKQNFQKELLQKEYTFDFDGEAIGSVLEEDKINYHSIKMRLSLMDKKLRSNIKFYDRDNSTEIKLEKKGSIGTGENSVSMELTAIPVFQPTGAADASALFGLPSEKQKCKLKQFKKHYGGKFSRLDRSLHTIDATSQKNDEYTQIFSQRRHFKDEQRSINESMISYRTRIEQATRRRLALPKIHGKYSTLDRYEQY